MAEQSLIPTTERIENAEKGLKVSASSALSAVKNHPDSSQRGTAAVEMALLLPVLVLIFLSVLELGRVLDAWVVATNAAREGARYAAYGETAQTVDSKVRTYLSNGLVGRSDIISPGLGEIVVTNAQGTPGSAVRVVVPIGVHIYDSWLVSFGLPDPLLVQGVATMRLQ